MSVTLNLPPEIEKLLRDRAERKGQTLEIYLEQVADREARSNGTTSTSADQVTGDLADFDHQLDELSKGLSQLPTLPGDFSRADIYGEHA